MPLRKNYIYSLVVLLFGLGCVSTNHKGHRETLRVVGKQPFSSPVRQQVYLFIMNGNDIFDLAGLSKLEQDLTASGYCKVYFAQKEDKAWYRREMARLHRDEPDARFVLLAYGSAAERVHDLAVAALHDQIPLDTVVFLEPAGLSGNLRDYLPTQTVTIRSHRRFDTVNLLTTQEYELVGLPGLGLVRHPQVVAIVVELMQQSASQVQLEDIRKTLPALPLHEYELPTPRGTVPDTLGSEPGYEFLPPMPKSISPAKPKKPKGSDAEQ